ncbi:MAG: VCBS repeat-containing protein [Mailhella sp.]|nr:VCBS repeat-containing protein [Mailhella sp.]
MSRRFLPVLWAFTLLFLLMQAPAMAASYVVAPFKVSGPQGYSYLGQAVPSMLTSRLFQQGTFEPAARQDAALKEKAPSSKDAAASMAKKYAADYIVWGSITVMGDQASLDVSALSPNGKVWKKASTSPVNALISGLQNVADSVNIEVFGRTDVAPATAAGGPASPNSAFMMNETHGNVSTSGTYLNSSLRYQGEESAASQIRSQMLKYECFGSEIADIDGDGKNEVLMLAKRKLYAYTWNGEKRLTQIAEYDLPAVMTPVLVRFFKEADGKRYIILTGSDENDRTAFSEVLTFSNGKFHTAVKFIDRYLNVVNLPPHFKPVLIGQDPDRSKTVGGKVYEMQIVDGKLVRRGNIANLPKNATVFNFAWIPAANGKGGDHVVTVTETENLATFNTKGQPLAVSQDVYCAGTTYILGDRGIGGLSAHEDDEIMSYVPIRLVVVDLDRDGRYEVLAVKPVTTAGKLFTNYRTYPQGEVHALIWDGMALDLLWKTRRIKGTVCDVTVADVDNNGRLDLVVTVNSFGGIMNGTNTRCALFIYPLDTTKVSAKPNYQE